MLYLHGASCFDSEDQDGSYQDRGNYWIAPSRNKNYIKKQEEEREAKSSDFPKCKTEHHRQECPLNKIPPCYICMGHHVFPQGIKMDPIKIEVIIGLLSPNCLPPSDS